MSVKDIEHTRHTLGMSSSLLYVIFGSPVGLSPSPNMHNTGFEYLHLRHHYRTHDTTDIVDVQQVHRRYTHIRTDDDSSCCWYTTRDVCVCTSQCVCVLCVLCSIHKSGTQS